MKNIIIFVIGFFFPLNVYGSELLMVHEHGCTWCETWEEEIGNIWRDLVGWLRKNIVQNDGSATQEYDYDPE